MRLPDQACWGLPDQVCTVGEAKAIYPLMGIAANVALVAAGNFMKAVNAALPVLCCLSNSSENRSRGLPEKVLHSGIHASCTGHWKPMSGATLSAVPLTERS